MSLFGSLPNHEDSSGSDWDDVDDDDRMYSGEVYLANESAPRTPEQPSRVFRPKKGRSAGEQPSAYDPEETGIQDQREATRTVSYNEAGSYRGDRGVAALDVDRSNEEDDSGYSWEDEDDEDYPEQGRDPMGYEGMVYGDDNEFDGNYLNEEGFNQQNEQGGFTGSFQLGEGSFSEDGEDMAPIQSVKSPLPSSVRPRQTRSPQGTPPQRSLRGTGAPKSQNGSAVTRPTPSAVQLSKNSRSPGRSPVPSRRPPKTTPTERARALPKAPGRRKSPRKKPTSMERQRSASPNRSRYPGPSTPVPMQSPSSPSERSSIYEDEDSFAEGQNDSVFSQSDPSDGNYWDDDENTSERQRDLEEGEQSTDPSSKGGSSMSYRTVEKRKAKQGSGEDNMRSLFFVVAVVTCGATFVALGIGLLIGLLLSNNGSTEVVVASPQEPRASSPPVVSGPTPSPTPVTITLNSITTDTDSPTAQPTTSPPVRTPSPTTISPATPSPTTFPPTLSPTLSPTTPSPTTAAPTTPEPTTTTPVTQSPTMPATPSPADILFELLAPLSPDNGTTMQTVGTPQNSAFNFMLAEREVQPLPDERTIQRYALATLYYSTNGDNWSNNQGWLSVLNECLWYTDSGPGACDAENNFIELNLDENNLLGTLPPELSMLGDALTRISFRDNSVSGEIPTEFGLFTRMNFLRLVGNQLSGTIPTEIGALGFLEVLNLSLNLIGGPIPTEIGGLASATAIILGSNEITGEIPTELAQCLGLTLLDLSDNLLRGPIPSELGNLQALQDVNIEQNELDFLPDEIGNIASLSNFIAHHNRIVGTLTTEIGRLQDLRELDLANNLIGGTLPTELGLLNGLRGGLDLGGNLFSGPIPSELGLIPRVRNIELQSNLLTGTVPVEIANLDRLDQIRLDGNMITGAVPDEVCTTWEANDILSYADCVSNVDCPCCIFCCEQINFVSDCVCQVLATQPALCSDVSQ